MDRKIVPWFTPQVSPALYAVVRNLGHRVAHKAGKVLYESTHMFDRVMFVQSGKVLRSVLLPGFEDTPFFVSVSLSGSLIGGVETLYAKDSTLRRQVAITDCEVLTVSSELLLQLADHEVTWHKELAGYNANCTCADRLGLIISRAGNVDERLASFILSYLFRSGNAVSGELSNPKKEWIAVSEIPSLDICAQVTGCEKERLLAVFSSWEDEGVVKKVSHRLLFERKRLLEYGEWLNHFL